MKREILLERIDKLKQVFSGSGAHDQERHGILYPLLT